MSGLFGSPKIPKQSQQQPRIRGIRAQSSAYGLVVPILYGTGRVAGNVIWHGKTQAVANTSTQQMGGKGGQSASQTSTKYTYSVAVALGLCEGVAGGFLHYWRDKHRKEGVPTAWDLFTGALTQAADSWLTSKHPSVALNYPGQVYALNPSLDLGTSSSLPNMGFEVEGLFAGAWDTPDADPSQIIPDLLANPLYGAGFPSASLGDFSALGAYCAAVGAGLSVLLDSQRTAVDVLKELAQAANFDFLFSDGKLTAVPLGDSPVTGSGSSWTPNLAPAYSFTDDDLKAPVKVTRTPQADTYNAVQVEFLDRENDYNPAVAEARDEASVSAFGLRPKPVVQLHSIASWSVARFAAQLLLQVGASARNTYTFTVSPRFILLDPLDVVAVSDSRVGLSGVLARVQSITENETGELEIIAADLAVGAYTVAGYGTEAGLGGGPDTDCPPGDALAPVVFEPTPALVNDAKEVWIATAGQQPFEEWTQGHSYKVGDVVSYEGDNYVCQVAVSNSKMDPLDDPTTWTHIAWGGCDVWVSQDGTTYERLGTIAGPCRFGLLALPLPASSNQFPTADTADTLTVDISACGGELFGGTQADADALRTLCWADGELLAYETATLTGAGKYALTYLQRGAYDTSPAAHSSGGIFVRLDDAVGRFPYKLEEGKTLYLKLQSFNVYGNALQDITTLPVYTYTIGGVGTLPDPTLTLEEPKLRRDLYVASWSRFRALRRLVVYKQPMSTYTGASPDADPSAWSLLHDIPLASPQADGSQACVIDHVRFSVPHKQGQQEAVAIQLRAAHEKVSGWTFNVGAASGGSDDSAPPMPVILGITSWNDDIHGTPGKQASAEVTVGYTGTVDRIEVEILDRRTGKKRTHFVSV